MNMQNTITTNQANQFKFDSFGLWLADFWLTVCGARLLYHHVQLAYAPLADTPKLSSSVNVFRRVVSVKFPFITTHNTTIF